MVSLLERIEDAQEVQLFEMVFSSGLGFMVVSMDQNELQVAAEAATV